MTFSKLEIKCPLTFIFFLLKCHLDVICLVRAILISNLSIDVWLFSSQVTLHVKILKCVCQLTCVFFVCKFLHVKCQKLTEDLVKNCTPSTTLSTWWLMQTSFNKLKENHQKKTLIYIYKINDQSHSFVPL